MNITRRPTGKCHVCGEPTGKRVHGDCGKEGEARLQQESGVSQKRRKNYYKNSERNYRTGRLPGFMFR